MGNMTWRGVTYYSAGAVMLRGDVYSAMATVVAAARSNDLRLLSLAIENLDRVDAGRGPGIDENHPVEVVLTT